MKPECPVCGRAFWVDYPNLWVFKRDGKFICSYGCSTKYDKRKEAENMARPRKDGTPARKPEKVKKATEEPKVELVYDPSIAEEYRREQEAKKGAELKVNLSINAEDLCKIDEEQHIVPAQVVNVIRGMEAPGITVTAIRTEMGEFHFDKMYGTIDWRAEINGIEIGEEIRLTPEDWAMMANKIPRILRILGADE